MMERTTISLSKKEHQILCRAKEAMERQIDRQLNWGDFLAILSTGILIEFHMDEARHRLDDSMKNAGG